MTLSATNPLSLFIHGSDDVDPRTSRPAPSNPILVSLPTAKRSPRRHAPCPRASKQASEHSLPLLFRSVVKSQLTFLFLFRRPRRSLKIVLIARCLESLVLLHPYKPPASTLLPSSVGQTACAPVFFFFFDPLPRPPLDGALLLGAPLNELNSTFQTNARDFHLTHNAILGRS